MTTQAVIFACYFLLMLAIGYVGMRATRNDTDFFIAGGNLGWALGGASIASTQMSSGLFIGTIGLMYAVGWSFGWVVFVFPIAYWFMVAVIAPRFTRLRLLSLPEFIATRYYSSAARVVAAVIILIAFVVYISAQVVAGGLIANTIFGISTETGMVLFTVILIAYTVVGGMIAVVYTDFLQMMVMVLGAAIAVPIVVRQVGGMDNLFLLVEQANPVSLSWDAMAPSLLFTLGLAFLLGSMARPEQLIRFYAMKDMPTIRRAIGFVIILVGLAHTLVFFLALGSRVLFPNIGGGDLAMPLIAQNAMPLVLGTVLLAAVAAAMMSTVDSVLIVAGAALSHDIYGTLRRESSPRRRVMIARIGTVIVGVIPLTMLLFGFAEGELVQIIVALFSALMGAAFLVPVVAGVLWRRATREGAIASMIGGVSATFLWRQFGDTETIDPVVPGFLTALVLMVAVSLLTARPPASAVEPFFTPEPAKPDAGPAVVRRS